MLLLFTLTAVLVINNIGIETFPDLIVARLFAFGARDLLEFEASETADVSVKELFQT